MNTSILQQHGNYGFGGEAKALRPTSFETSPQKNWYIIEATVQILVDDELDQINSQIMLGKRVQDEFQSKVISFKILDEEHFTKTHYYDFGYHRIFLGKVEEDSGEYYYQKTSSTLDTVLERVEHVTIDGEDWIVTDDYKLKIKIATKETFRDPDREMKAMSPGLGSSRKSLR